jgi:hypothetical protein
MTDTNYWDRFPKADEPQGQVPESDYWGQFPTAEETNGIDAQEPGLEGQQPPIDQQPSLEQPPETDPSFWAKTKRLAGVADHGFSQGVGGLADIAATAEERNTPPAYQAKQGVQQEVETEAHSDPVIADYLGKKVNELFGNNLSPKDAFEKFVHLAGEFSVPIPGLGVAKAGVDRGGVVGFTTPPLKQPLCP